MAFDLRISEIFSGQSGSDLTSDWFEITNIGTTAWVQGVDADLFYDDESEDATTADAITGLTAIAPGESVIVLVDSTDIAAFEAAWGDVRDLSNVQIGTIDSAAGLGGGGDAVTLFADRAGDGVDAGDVIDSAAYPDTDANDGQTWDVAAQAFSQAGVDGAVATNAMGGDAANVPNVGSPGSVANADALAPAAPGDADFTLELLHFTDQEAAAAAVVDAPNLSAVLNALRAEDLGEDGLADNTLVLSSGDAIIPGLFFDASEAVFGSAGIADIQIQNELGVQAIALGNHEFDYGTELLASLIDGSAEGDFSALTGSTLEGLDFTGTDMPYLSTNLDFSTDANMAGLVTEGGQAPQANVVSSSTVIDTNGEMIGVVGATTPTLATISSPGDVTVNPAWASGTPTDAELDALAAEIQSEVDTLLEANPEMNKVVLLAHMQQISIELDLAERLTDVDIIVAGGSNTRLFDDDDTPRAGDSDQGQYPLFVENAGGTNTAVVNTDGSYKYVGRLVIDFDADGNIIAESYDETISGAYATDEAGVAALEAEGLIDPEIQDIADAIEAQIVATESNVFGVSEVFLNGNRTGTGAVDDPDGVRTQETNLGNLTADANLAAAQAVDETVVVSIKNGGGIRASIGETIVPAAGTEAVRSANSEVTDGDGNVVKPEGGISQNDIQAALAFNNGLSLVTVTREELINVLEHALGDIGGGRFPQVSGLQFSYDADNEAGSRVVDASIVDPETGEVIAELMSDGTLVGDANEGFRVVTLNYLAGGGDGYPFDALAAADRVDLYDLDGDGENDGATGDATFADDGTEQDALAEYLDDVYNPANGGTAYAEDDTGLDGDTRIIDVDAVDSAPQGPVATEQLTFTRSELSVNSESGAEIPAFDPTTNKIFVAGGETSVEMITLASDLTASAIETLDIAAMVPGASAVTSVDVKNGVLVAAVQVEDADGNQTNGVAAFFNTADGSLITTVEVGIGPDMVTFTPDGTKVLTADEGENDDPIDPAGSISIIDVTPADAAAWTADVNGFEGFDAATLDAAGVRLFPGKTPEFDLEPEYIAVSADSSQAFVTLQEANAIATVDLTTGEIVSIEGLGTVDHALDGNEIDTNDEDGVLTLGTAPVKGLRMPDGLTSFTVGGQAYFITANEGDARDSDVRLADVTLDETAFPNAAELQDNAVMGRLQISGIDGDTDGDGDGDYDALFSYGSRSFSIFDAEGNLVFDSGSALAEIADAAGIYPDGRSDNKGTEPENVTVGQIGSQTFAFVALERASAVAVFDVTDPTDPAYVNLISDEADSEPEGLEFVSMQDSPSGKPLLIVTNEDSKTTVVHEIEVATLDTTIGDVQGAGHVSAYVRGSMTDAEFLAANAEASVYNVYSGQQVRVEGVVTAVDGNGFYLQDPTGDGDAATSDAIFVYSGSEPTVAVGDSVAVTGEVAEYYPGGSASGNLPTTQLVSPQIETIADLGPVTATIIGEGGVMLPDMSIDGDSFAEFDVDTDGLDAFEALEGMLVTAQDMVAVSGTNAYNELFAVTDMGANASGLSERGTLNISESDFNPERIQIDPDYDLLDLDLSAINTGDSLGNVTGVMNYDYGNFQITPTVDFLSQVVSAGLEPEVSTLTAGEGELLIASYNVLNLDPVIEDEANILPGTYNAVDDDLGDGRFDAIANQIVSNLNTPDIIGLQEIQDNTGAEGTDDVTSASDTLQQLIDSIAAAGGPTYAYVDNTFIGDDTSGGIPGGNIRTAYLYNPERVSVVDGSVRTISSQDAGAAFEGGRLPLVASFAFGDEEVTVVNNHFSSKSGSAPIMGIDQEFADLQEDPSVNGAVDERQAQSAEVQGFVEGLLVEDGAANVVVLGDFNEFEFVSPLEELEGSGLVNLTNSLPEDERYSYSFQGNSQSLDHILVSNNLGLDAEFDAVHVNSEFAVTDESASDHDPVLAKVSLGSKSFAGVTEGFQRTFGGAHSSADLLVDGQQVSFGGTTFGVDADLETGRFLSASDGNTTELAFVGDLLGNGADLREAEEVSEDQINGIAFDDYLIGNGQADFTIELDSSEAGYHNSLGYYYYDSETGTASNVTILEADVKSPAGGASYQIDNVDEGAELAFFVVRDGEDMVEGLSDELVFDFSGDKPVLQDNGVDLDLDIYHSLGAEFSADDREHFLSGAVADGSGLRVGVEDKMNTGDADYQDVVFLVSRDEDFVFV